MIDLIKHGFGSLLCISWSQSLGLQWLTNVGRSRQGGKGQVVLILLHWKTRYGLALIRHG